MNNKNKLYYALAVLLIVIFGSVLFYNVKIFDTEKFTNPGTLTYFYSPNCGYCKEFSPIWDGDVSDSNSLAYKLKEKNVQVNLKKVDITDTKNSKLANDKHIQGVPAIFFTDSNGVDTEFTETRSPETIATFVKTKST